MDGILHECIVLGCEWLDNHSLICRYVPTSQVQFQYPDNYKFSDIVSCHEDTNLLRTTPEKNEIRPFRPEDQIRRGIQEAEQSLASLKRDH